MKLYWTILSIIFTIFWIILLIWGDLSGDIKGLSALILACYFGI